MKSQDKKSNKTKKFQHFKRYYLSVDDATFC